MQEKTIEDYERELREANKKRVAFATPLPHYELTDNSLGRGKLVVILTAARGAYPLSNGEVKVYNNLDKKLVATLKTDENGQTYALGLAAPRRNLSETPGEESSNTYALYDVVAFAQGFETMYINAVPIFDGVTSLQTVNMLSESVANGNTGTTENTKNNYQL